MSTYRYEQLTFGECGTQISELDNSSSDRGGSARIFFGKVNVTKTPNARQTFPLMIVNTGGQQYQQNRSNVTK